ncbi:hypothetical protein B0H12DRAFT_1239189 [Mycena haematopus]|nr:hypothetical protein B0H12DRAFT_1239189 [Mycena haematopus]
MLCTRHSFPTLSPLIHSPHNASSALLQSLPLRPPPPRLRYPTIPAATSLASELHWVLVVYMLVCDARTFVGRVVSARAGPSTGLIALEEGSAPTTPVPPPPPTTAAAPAPKTPLTLPQKLTSLLSSTFFLVSQILTSDLHRPLLDTAAAALTYVLRGCEVLFALFLVVVRVRGVRPAPVEVPVRVEVDVLVVDDDEKKALVEES